MALAVPLKQNQLEAANRLHRRLEQWRLSENALLKLGTALPDWSLDSSLLKCVAVNSIYGTQVLAIIRMAQHVREVLKGGEGKTTTDLVERIAALPKLKNERGRHFISFASKLCHFFIDSERYQIYDEAARNALKLHLGKSNYIEDKEKPFAAFRRNVEQLRQEAGIKGNNRELDHYLWLTGMYIKWRNKPKLVNAELKQLFSSREAQDVSDISEMLPTSLLLKRRV
jgi:hypothetical protein